MRNNRPDWVTIFSIHCIPILILFSSTRGFIPGILESIDFYRIDFLTPFIMNFSMI